jgi:hypothetical protein
LEDPSEAELPNSGLSVGSKVAIGVCVPLGLLAIGFAIFFLIRRRKSKGSHILDDDGILLARKNNQPFEIPGSQPRQVDPSHDAASSRFPVHSSTVSSPMAHTNDKQELESVSPMAELSGITHTVELPAPVPKTHQGYVHEEIK